MTIAYYNWYETWGNYWFEGIVMGQATLDEKEGRISFASNQTKNKTEVVPGIRTGCYATICDQRRVTDYEANPQESPCEFQGKSGVVRAPRGCPDLGELA